MKKIVTINIESEIHQKFKDKFFNVSAKIEELMKQALNYYEEVESKKEKFCSKCGKVAQFWSENLGDLCFICDRIFNRGH